MNWEINKLSSDDVIFLLSNALAVIALEVSEGNQEKVNEFVDELMTIAFSQFFNSSREERETLIKNVKQGLLVHYQSQKQANQKAEDN